MALATIRPKTASASIMIDSVEYNTVMSFARVTSDAPRIDETVFSTENTGGESSVGTEVLTLDLSGIMKRGSAEASPLIPLPQDVAFVVAWDSGCQIAGTCNFTRASAGRGAGTTGTIDGQAYSTGAFTKTWNSSS
jgi:hypothetical protein